MPSRPEFALEEGLCRRFFQEFSYKDEISMEPVLKYMRLLQKISDREEKSLLVELDDVKNFFEDEEEGKSFVYSILKNTKRYVKIFSSVADELMPPSSEKFEPSVLDIFVNHRTLIANNNERNQDPKKRYPPLLLRNYELYFKNLCGTKSKSIRQIKSEHVGHLVDFEGIITRATEVKANITVATYTCDKCDTEIYQEVTASQFMPIHTCISETCKVNKLNGKLFMQTRGSKFTKYQELRVQELSHHVPVGNIPRSIKVIATGEITRTATTGDLVNICGIFLPVPVAGFSGIRQGLTANTYIEAHLIDKQKHSNLENLETIEVEQEIEKLKEESHLYDRLSTSIAPEIYGHDDVKKALLLLLTGGTSRDIADGMKIRGDLNICLMGDPGVAKSQLLKHIASLNPRGIYTSGSGTSGAGLTAAVTRDPLTGEMTLEGGALVLADQGVCCIDEFDKMDDSDRTSIHEVMEQQTISIAKAGVTTTLNARTSILAAANPKYGRYNPKRSPTDNINLPAALLSRFDLLFLLLDRPDVDGDSRLAQHITYLHQHYEHPPLDHDRVPPKVLRRFIAMARSFNPIIPKELDNYIVAHYVEMRAESRGDKAALHTTPRTLLAILRLCTALARIRFSDVVNQYDVDEAIRLTAMSKSSIFDVRDSAHSKPKSTVERWFDVLRALSERSDTKSVSYSELVSAGVSKGLREEQLSVCLEEYEDLNVIQVNRNRTLVKFIH